LIGDAGGFGRIFFGRKAALPVVGLFFLVDGGDGEESTVFTNLTTVSHAKTLHSSQVRVPRPASPSVTGSICYFREFHAFFRCDQVLLLAQTNQSRTPLGVHFAKLVLSVAFQAGRIGDAGGFGLVFFGIPGFLAVVFLPVLGDCIDGEESSVCTNFTSISSRIVAIEPVGFTGFSGLTGCFACKSRGLDGILTGGSMPGFTLIRYSSMNTCSPVR
jgi:hypothetical protein